MPATLEIRPQPGPQEAFLASPADIVIYGGAAGGGKSFALLLEPLRHLTTVPGFGAVTFRRTTPQIRNEGGLWDTSEEIYSPIGLKPRESVLEWEHPRTGNTIKFAHLEHEADVQNWQGAQIAFLGFDELTHFTAKQFWYMLSRNRSTCGVRPYVRATTNPDADSWVADLIAWWIDQDPTSPTYGQPIPKRAGVIRWFARIDGELHWGDSPGELRELRPDLEPKSLTFIPSSLEDNPALVRADPGYRANLMALDPVEQARLLHGNWKARATSGTLFQRAWVRMLDAPPPPTELKRVVRAWDFAGTPVTPESPDPDWTVSVKVARTTADRFVILDATRTRATPGEVERHFVTTTLADDLTVLTRIPQDPGEAGKTLAQHRVNHRDLAKRTIKAERVTGDKVTRFGPASSRAYAGLIDIVRAPWNDWLLADLEAFPDAAHDDTADALADAITELATARTRTPPQTSFSTYTLS